MVKIQKMPIEKHTFISYSRRDGDFARKLAQDLRAAGVSIWLDQLDIPPGARWDRTVDQALRKCGRLLLILSPDSVGSENVMDEVAVAMHEGKPVVPVLHRPCEIPLRLFRLQYIDFTEDYADGLNKLIANLKSELAPAAKKEKSSAHPERKTLSWRRPLIIFASLAVLAVAAFAVLDSIKEKPTNTGQTLAAEQDSLYNKYCDEGDKLFKEGIYEEAKSKFAEALQLKAEDRFATEKINLCEQRIAKQANRAEREQRYDKYKREADALFNQGKYEEAKLSYKNALELKPGDSYAKAQIEACDQETAKLAAAREKRYIYYKGEGDKLFDQGNYAEAKDQYEKALSYQADDQYVLKQMRACEKKLSRIPSGRETETPTGMRVIEAILRADPFDYTGNCPVTIKFSGRISVVGGSGRVSFRFIRSDGASAPIQTVSFEGPGSKDVSTTWMLGRSYSGWQAIQILEPKEMQSQPAQFKLVCR